MKKSIVMTVLAAAVLVACSSGNVEKKTAKFHQEEETIIRDLTEARTAVEKDTTLTGEQIQAKSEELKDMALEKYKELCLKTIKANRNNELGVMAFREVCEELSLEEREKYIKMFSPKMQKTDFIVRTKESIAVLKKSAEGQPFTDFKVDGVRFSDYVGRGKYVLVDFWASWCGPCKREVPNLKHVYETYAGDDFDVLSVAVWDDPEDTKRAAEELGIVWSQIINAQTIASEAYGFNSIPQIMLFGPDGTIIKKGLRGGAIEKAVKEALGR